jgi:hypothetical protein
LNQLSVELPVIPSSKAVHVVVDSTGVKVYGEGEWKVRTHGVGKRRTWRKLHLGVDEGTGEILAAVVTTNDVASKEVLPDLLEQVDASIEQVSGDGGYDTFECYDTITSRQAKAVIAPRTNAKIKQPNECKPLPHPLSESIRRVRQVGSKQWKQESDYHRRSLSETAMFRLKSFFGGMSSDTAAGLVLARRAMRLSESVPTHVALPAVMVASRHVWASWYRINKSLKSVRRHEYYNKQALTAHLSHHFTGQNPVEVGKSEVNPAEEPSESLGCNPELAVKVG